MEKRLKDGIPIDDKTWSALASLARDLNVTID
jgi:LDH2 family malate/lactate/ureidoglycolate dehydrogenase